MPKWSRHAGAQRLPHAQCPWSSRHSPTWQLIAFAVLVGLLAAATSAYGYGKGPSALHLMEVLRTSDPGLLRKDFWLNAQDAFGPRFYYRLAVAAAAVAVPLWLVYAVAYALGAVGTSVATALAARDLAGSRLAAFVAVPLVMWTLPYDGLGTWPAIYNARGGIRWVDPVRLAEPLCLLALWRGLVGRPVQAAAFSVPAILLHPAFGLGSAAVALAAALAHLCGRPARGRGALALAAAAGIVAVVVGGCWVVPGVLSGAVFGLDGSEVVRLLAYVRHPEHLLPSTWGADRFVRPAVFWGAGALALAGLRRRPKVGELGTEGARYVAAIATALVTVGCALACGWFFVEVVPSRWAAAAYLLRLNSLASWLCWIVLATVVADALWQSWRCVRARLPAWASQPVAWLEGPPLRWAVLMCLGALLAGLVAISFGPHRAQWLPDSVAVRVVRMAWALNAPQTVFTLRDQRPWRPDESALAAVARTETPADAVFLVPKSWIEWRLLARRAVVVDWAFAFREDQMRAWYERYVRVFDLERGAGYPSRATERWLRELALTYRIDYAVVPRSSCLRWRTLATAGDWKLVAVSLDPSRRDGS